MRPNFIVLGLSVVAGAAGCGSMAQSGDDVGGTYNCATETRATPYTPGMEFHGQSGKLDFKLMSADPDPPMSGNNKWVIEIDSLSANVAGAPMAGATMSVYPYMPDHMHTTPIGVSVTPTSTAGQYLLDPVNLWMPGFWETTVDATAPDGTEDKGVFNICIPS